MLSGSAASAPSPTGGQDAAYGAGEGGDQADDERRRSPGVEGAVVQRLGSLSEPLDDAAAASLQPTPGKGTATNRAPGPDRASA
nr:hypothetical protein [Streptomyces hygroscopicus]